MVMENKNKVIEATFTEWKKTRPEFVKASKESIKEANARFQVQKGAVIEDNFIKAAMQASDTSNGGIVVQRTSKDVDYFYGADFKLTYKKTGMKHIDGHSIYVDITCNPNKKGVTLLQENFYTMSNGCKVSLGVKTENTHFYYYKPVLVIMLHSDWNIITFEEADLHAIFFAAIKTALYIANEMEFEYAGAIRVGGGKRASDKVAVKSKGKYIDSLLSK